MRHHTRTEGDHSTESVGDIKKIEALGALKLLSGGSASRAAVDDLNKATVRNLNLVVGQRHNAMANGDMSERIQRLPNIATVTTVGVRGRPGSVSAPTGSTYCRCCAICLTWCSR